MIFRRKQKAADLAALMSELEQAVAARDGGRTERAFGAAMSGLQSATGTECVPVGPRLAALLPACEPLVRVEGAAHASNLTHPEAVNGPLRDFVQRHG